MSKARQLADLLDSNGDVDVTALDNVVSFESGTAITFNQTTAPTGWTKQTVHNDKALRVVSGSVGSGGSTAFSSAMAAPAVTGSVGISGAPAAGNLAVSMSGNIASTTLSVNTIPSHSHTGAQRQSTPRSGYYATTEYHVNSATSTGNTGNSGAHGHSHNLAGTLNGAPSVGNLAGSLSSASAAINVQYVDVIIASKD